MPDQTVEVTPNSPVTVTVTSAPNAASSASPVVSTASNKATAIQALRSVATNVENSVEARIAAAEHLLYVDVEQPVKVAAKDVDTWAKKVWRYAAGAVVGALAAYCAYRFGLI